MSKRGRKPSVRYWNRKGGGYFVTLNGRQVELALGPDDSPNGPTYLEALKKWSALVAMEGEAKGSNNYLLSALFNKFREHLETDKGRRARMRFDNFLGGFNERCGHLPVCQVRVNMWDEWIREQPQWNPTSKHHSGRLLLSALNWGVKKEYIAANPLHGKLELPGRLFRGREARMPEELCQLLVRRCHSGEFGLLLRVLHATGARPAEVWRAEGFNYKAGRLLYEWNASRGYIHKTATTQRHRIVCLTPELDVEVRALVKKYPTGRLFRTPRGLGWQPTNIQQTWQRLLTHPDVVSYCRTFNIPAGSLVPYNFRHTWITNWVESGRSIHIAARLTGTSVKMIEKVYGHPEDDLLVEHYLSFMSSPKV